MSNLNEIQNLAKIEMFPDA